MSRFLNLAFYQAGWFACVLGVAWNLQWIGIGIAMGLILMHLWLAPDRCLQIKMGLTAATIGLIVDSGLLWAQVFTFPRGSIVDWLAPPAITVLWLQFATTLRYSMGWLSRRYMMSVCFGLIGAPMAFFAGERLGAVEFLSPRLVSFAIVGVVWSCTVPLLVFISDRWATVDGVAPSYRWPRANRADRGERRAK